MFIDMPCKPHDINLNVIDKFKSMALYRFLTTNNILPAVAAVKGAKIVKYIYLIKIL